MNERALSVWDVAREYNVTRQTVYAWIKAGSLAGLRLPGGDYRFRRTDLEVFEKLCRGQETKSGGPRCH